MRTEELVIYLQKIYPYGILPLITSLGFIVIIANLILKGYKRKIAWASFTFCLNLVIWIIAGGILFVFPESDFLSVVKEIYFCAWLFIPVSTYYFTITFSNSRSPYIYVFLFISLLLVFLNYYFDLSAVQKGYFGHYPRLLFPMNYIGNTYYFTCSSIALIHLYEVFINSVDSIKRNQARLLWLGTSIGFMISITETMYVLSQNGVAEKSEADTVKYIINLSIIALVILCYVILLYMYRSVKRGRFRLLSPMKSVGGIALLLLPYNLGLTYLLIQHSYAMYPLKDIGLIIGIFFISYAILRYRLVDITEIFRGYYVYIFVSLLFISLYFWIISFLETDSRTIMLLLFYVFLMVLLFNPLQMALQNFINRFVLGQKYDYQQTLRDISMQLVTVLDYNRLIELITDAVVTNLKVTSFALILYDEDTDNYGVASSYGVDADEQLTFSPSHALINVLRLANREIFLEELVEKGEDEFNREYRDFFNYFRAVVIIPMTYTGRLRGILSLGDKASGDIYNQEDIALMQIMGNQLSNALDNARLYELAIRDGLTRLYISRFFHQRILEEIMSAIRQKRSLSLLMIDLDHFKSINDTYGHQVGDVLLKEISRLIVEHVRMIDLVARYGGEEFAVILPETENEIAVTIAERIRKSVENHIFYEQILKTVSIGIATIDGGSLSDTIYYDANLTKMEREQITEQVKIVLIKEADDALYGAKREGRNRCRNAGVIKSMPERGD